MRRALAGFVFVSILAALAFAGLRMMGGAGTARAINPPSMDAMNIDMDPSSAPANTATSVGSVELCARADNDGVTNFDEDSVDTASVDVTAVNIPAANKIRCRWPGP